MKTYTQEELKEVLRLHKLWLKNNISGVRANLRYANLSYANLRYANLSSANLRYADLRYADLRYADLSYADLRYADLRYANLSYANLSSANLSSANLSSANLSSANLSYANLSSADLRSAALSHADGEIYKAIMLWNLKYNVTIMDTYLWWGCRKFTFEEFKKFKFKDCEDIWCEKEFDFNYKTIKDHIKFYRSKS